MGKQCSSYRASREKAFPAGGFFNSFIEVCLTYSKLYIKCLIQDVLTYVGICETIVTIKIKNTSNTHKDFSGSFVIPTSPVIPLSHTYPPLTSDLLCAARDSLILFQSFICGVIQCISFFVWWLLLSIIVLRLVHVECAHIVHSFYTLYGCTIVYLPVDGYLDYLLLFGYSQ